MSVAVEIPVEDVLEADSTKGLVASDDLKASHPNKDENYKVQNANWSQQTLKGGLSAPKKRERPTPGEIAIYKVLAKCEELQPNSQSYLSPPFQSEINPNEFMSLGWPLPLYTTERPNPYTIPEELVTFVPSDSQKFIKFFSGTPKEVSIRQVFCHTPLDSDEASYIKNFRQYCCTQEFEIPALLEPLLLRTLLYNKRKYPNEYNSRSLDHMKQMLQWRKVTYPLRDDEEGVREDLRSGTMYWAARDSSFRPLLIVNISRMTRNEKFSDRFIRLCLFCFEWGLRYLMVPGKVETCAVLMDLRGVALHNLPVNALSELITVLTKQYPFRLNRMWVIHDSLFIQMLWGIAKAFLSDIQQQKIKIMKSGFQEALIQEYNPFQIEKHYGGSLPEHKEFYPFPMSKGPFITIPVRDHKKSKSGGIPKEDLEVELVIDLTTPHKQIWKCSDFITQFGSIWEDDCKLPTLWSQETFGIFPDIPIETVYMSLKNDSLARTYCSVVSKWRGEEENGEQKLEELTKLQSQLYSIAKLDSTGSSKSKEEEKHRKVSSFMEYTKSFSLRLSRSSSIDAAKPCAAKVRQEHQQDGVMSVYASPLINQSQEEIMSEVEYKTQGNKKPNFLKKFMSACRPTRAYKKGLV